MDVAEDRVGPLKTTRRVARSDADSVDRSARITKRVVYGGAATYGLVFAAVVVVHYLSFQEARLDLGDIVQAIWSTAHGHFLDQTGLTGRQFSRLGAHVEPFLILLVPLWWAWSSPIALLVLQAIAVASGALPVYWLARKHLPSERAAGHFAFAYLLYPATQYNAFTVSTGFHAVSIAVPLLLYAIWFLDEERLVAFGVFAVLAASTKEEIPAAVACLGIWYAVRHGRRLPGLCIAVLGVGATLVNFLLVIPHYSPSGVNPFAARYGEIGGTPSGAVHTALHNPMAFLHSVATWHKLIFVVLVLAPFLGLWLLEPLLALGAAPDLVIDLLSSKPEQTTIQFHYTAGIIPFIVAASIFGAAKIKRDPDRTSFYALAGAAALALYSPIYFAGQDFRTVFGSDPARAAKAHAIEMVPASAPVSASSQLAGYLSARSRIVAFPYLADATWVVVDKNDGTYGSAEFLKRAVRRINASPKWRVVFFSHGIEVLRKRSPADPK